MVDHTYRERVPDLECACRIRCYPTARQRPVLARLFGVSRRVWNGALARRSSAYRCEKTRLDWVALSGIHSVAPLERDRLAE